MTTDVTLLTRPACDLCDQAKRSLDRVAQDFDIAVTTIGLDSTEGQALAAKTGILFPPGLLLDGEPFCYGRLSERKLRRALQRAERQDAAGPPAG